MFLNEVALGKEKEIDRDDSSIISPPKGFDSVVAKGHQEPGEHDPNDSNVTQYWFSNELTFMLISRRSVTGHRPQV